QALLGANGRLKLAADAVVGVELNVGAAADHRGGDLVDDDASADGDVVLVAAARVDDEGLAQVQTQVVIAGRHRDVHDELIGRHRETGARAGRDALHV